jgi:hypothetical protein
MGDHNRTIKATGMWLASSLDPQPCEQWRNSIPMPRESSECSKGARVGCARDAQGLEVKERVMPGSRNGIGQWCERKQRRSRGKKSTVEVGKGRSNRESVSRNQKQEEVRNGQGKKKKATSSENTEGYLNGWGNTRTESGIQLCKIGRPALFFLVLLPLPLPLLPLLLARL